MPNYKNAYWNDVFSHVYVEREALAYPATAQILEKLKDRVLVPIGHYKDVFNRAGQDFLAQKQSPKLILAVRRSHFLFEGATVCDHYGYTRFFYASQMMNCLYDCEYCYLRGMYPSANVVAFVNTADYFTAVTEALPAYLSVSYDTDLLAFEPLMGFTASWIGFAQSAAANDRSLTLEIRTKSAAFAAIASLPPADNVILAWTVSPRAIIDRFEHRAASLDKRIEAINAALAAGWRVRLCIDPILKIDGWEAAYTGLRNELAARIDFTRLHDVSEGGFRVSKTYYKRMRRLQPASAVFTLPLVEKDGVMQYNE